MIKFSLFFVYYFLYKISFNLFIIFDNLVEFGKLSLLIFSELLHNKCLSIDCVTHLLLELLNWSFHPMFIIECWLNVYLFELKFDLRPDFAYFEMWIHLDDLHLLLFMSIQIIFVEADSIQNTEDNQPDIIFFNLFLDSVNKISFHSSLGQIFKICLLFF